MRILRLVKNKVCNGKESTMLTGMPTDQWASHYPQSLKTGHQRHKSFICGTIRGVTYSKFYSSLLFTYFQQRAKITGTSSSFKALF